MEKPKGGFIKRTAPIVGGIPGFYVHTVEGVDVVVCPFNRAHMLKASRLQYHLVKCAKSQPAGSLIQCPFNAKEFVPVSEFTEHLTFCEGRKQVSQRLVQLGPTDSFCVKHVPISQDCPYEQDEQW
ncbi:Gametocyte specific factor 1 [Nesidiocoris tenuis]|uniref:Gametocyte specific factor 1 n=1 Tax=Nesidiocoris tenuis TaxID=355587 RepID=A0ABN7BD51_9HEMI|nr:Gametocyte specific factor 1 [Nesidiocoris tenuis]